MAQTKLSRGAEWRLERMLYRLEQGSLAINKLDDKVLRDLIKRAAISSHPDGFSSSSRLGDGGRGQSDSTPVESAAASREKPQRDELSKRVKHIESLITFIDVAAHEIHSNIGEIYRVEEEKAQRPVQTTPCLVCEAAPAEIAGYCRADYDVWRNYGNPDRLRWEMFKKQTTSVDGLLMVPKCPPPADGRSARRGPWKTGVQQDLTRSGSAL